MLKVINMPQVTLSFCCVCKEKVPQKYFHAHINNGATKYLCGLQCVILLAGKEVEQLGKSIIDNHPNVKNSDHVELEIAIAELSSAELESRLDLERKVK